MCFSNFLFTPKVRKPFPDPVRMMKRNLLFFALLTLGAVAFAAAETDNGAPHLETLHGVRQLVVDGKPFLILGGELSNSAASSRVWMKPIWTQLAQRNLNTVIASVTWQMIEPVEGEFDFSSVDDCIEGARANNLRLVFLWFATWKNGQSSYPPDWVKNDPKRFPWAKDGNGNTMNILTPFSDATCEADAKAFAALMRHIREVDGKNHTVLMMQVENEVGTVGDSRDRSPVANEAYAAAVPKDLMSYLVGHKDTLAPELRQVWTANGNKTSGTWEEVFGPGKPASVTLYGHDITPQMRDVLWRQVTWASDECFMAWRYSSFVNKVAAAGKAEYDIPMYCNAWLQQPGCPRPGEFPSGGPLPEVHDIWRFGAPNIDILSPDLYLSQFDETCARFTRNGNPLFIAEANTGGSAPGNSLICLIKYNGIGFSPFGIDREGRRGRGAPAQSGTDAAITPPPDAFAQTYGLLQYLAPVILDNQGKGTMDFLNETTGTDAAPEEIKLGDYTLSIKYGASAVGTGGRGGFGGFGGFNAGPTYTNVSPLRLVINTGPGAYVFVGGPMTVTFKPNDPARGTVILSSTIETINQNGQWLPGRWLNGDETGHNTRSSPQDSGIYVRSFGIHRYSVFQRN
jgi:hypothetical protein